MQTPFEQTDRASIGLTQGWENLGLYCQVFCSQFSLKAIYYCNFHQFQTRIKEIFKKPIHRNTFFLFYLKKIYNSNWTLLILPD